MISKLYDELKNSINYEPEKNINMNLMDTVLEVTKRLINIMTK